MSEPADTGLETLLDLDGITYRLNYESAAQLIQDFWDEVERIIGGGRP